MVMNYNHHRPKMLPRAFFTSSIEDENLQGWVWNVVYLLWGNPGVMPD